MPGRIEFEMKLSTAGKDKKRRSQQSPMQILLMGNLSGHRHDVANAGVNRIQKLDLDNFDRLMGVITPRLEIAIGENLAEVMEIEFKELEDFHPDRLFDRLSLFQDLKSLRANLGNPSTFAQAAAQMTGVTDTATPANSVEQPHVSADAGLLDQLLGDRAAHIAGEPTAVQGQKRVDISAFIRNAIAPHIETGAHPQQEQYIKSVDHTISELMRRILHHPDFQALEATWRGVYECVTRLELDESLNIFLLNISKRQIKEDLEKCEDLSLSLLYQTVVEQSVQTLGGEPWSLLAGLYSFSNQNGDIELLSKLGQVACHSGGPFVACADTSVLGCDSLMVQPDASQWKIPSEAQLENWNALRDQPYAPWLGLTFPRFLLRLPYGRKSEEIERFAFEEIPDSLDEEQRHRCYLWGNASIICALLIAQSYQQSGWSMSLGDVLELDDLPLHVYESYGEKTIKPCAEVVMSERSAESIESLGIMAIMSYKNRNALRLWRFRSLGRKNPGLSGPWED